MKKIVAVSIFTSAIANTNLGLLLWNGRNLSDSKLTSSAGNVNALGDKEFIGGSLIMPLSILMGSKVELGMSIIPSKTWQIGSSSISVSSRRRYSINTVYNASDSISLIAGVALLKQELSCSDTGCNKVKQDTAYKDKLGINLGAQWLYPIANNIEAGVRLMYSLKGNNRKYCYGKDSCDKTIAESENKLKIMTVIEAGL